MVIFFGAKSVATTSSLKIRNRQKKIGTCKNMWASKAWNLFELQRIVKCSNKATQLDKQIKLKPGELQESMSSDENWWKVGQWRAPGAPTARLGLAPYCTSVIATRNPETWKICWASLDDWFFRLRASLHCSHVKDFCESKGLFNATCIMQVSSGASTELFWS